MSTERTPETFDTGLRPERYERPAPIETPWGSFALYRLQVAPGGARETDFVALQSFCPHLEAPLFQGTRSGDEITCPWHRWRFDLTTGELLSAECSPPEEPIGPQHDLVRCEVRLSPAGTLVLVRPRTRT